MKNVLFTKFYALGDIITTLDFLNSVDDKNFNISLLTSKEYKFIYEDIFRYKKKINTIAFDNNLIKNAFRLFFSKLWFERYDECWIGHRSFILAIIMLVITRSKVKYFGERKLFNLIEPLSFEIAESHAEEYFRFNPKFDKNIFTFEYEYKNSKNLLKNQDLLGKSVAPRLFIAIGSGNALASGKNKMWPIQNFVRLIDRLNVSIVLLGTKDEISMGEFISKNVINKEKIINLIGKTKIVEMTDLFQYADFFIGHDSGLSWFSAITKTPSLILHGPTNPKYYGPSKPWVHKIQSNSPCLNCYDFKHSINGMMYKCKKNICLQDLSVDLVETKMSQIFKKYNQNVLK